MMSSCTIYINECVKMSQMRNPFFFSDERAEREAYLTTSSFFKGRTCTTRESLLFVTKRRILMVFRY